MVCSLFGIAGGTSAVLTPVARGAVGRIWRLDVGAERFAVKELFDEPDVTAVGSETRFTAHLAAAGVPLPRSLPTPDGRFVVTAGGHHLRLYQWVDGKPVDLDGAEVPERLGELLGRLHANALPPSGDVDPWYEVAPDQGSWAPLARRAERVPWGPRLVAALDLIAELSALVTPMAPGSLVTCHRDLHPENVLVTADGGWVPLDWEDVGPANPDRELAKLLLDWLVTDGRVDRTVLDRTLATYYAAGGTGRLTGEHTFGMAIAADLNFLHLQATRALAPETAPEHRAHATAEVEESLGRLPTIALLTTLVEGSTSQVR